MLRTVLLVCALAALGSGCVAVAAAGVLGVGIVQYQRNEVEDDFPTGFEETWRASLETLRRLEIEPTEAELGATEGRIVHEDLVILVERHPEGFTRVRVRVNTFHSADNERRERILLEEIASSIAHEDELRAWVEKAKPPPATPGPQPALE